MPGFCVGSPCAGKGVGPTLRTARRRLISPPTGSACACASTSTLRQRLSLEAFLFSAPGFSAFSEALRFLGAGLPLLDPSCFLS